MLSPDQTLRGRPIRDGYRRCFGFLLLLGLGLTLYADDWPQWLGPKRDGVWREAGIVEKFPAEGLRVEWRAPVHLGYAGPAVAQGRVYVMDYHKLSGDLNNNPGGRTLLDGMERIQCFDAKTGRLLWKHEYERPYQISYAGGPRCTPTVADGKVYALGAEGNLTCLDAKEGTVLWQKDFKRDYKASTQIWGHAAHPLVDGNLVYCLVGGDGTAVVAFHKDTGEEQWRALSAQDPGYAPPVFIEGHGPRQLLVWLPDGLESLNPQTGQGYWSIPLKPAYSLTSSTPRQAGDLLYASGIGNVGALIQLNDTPGAEVLWRGRTKQAVYCSNGTPFLTEDTLYGADIESSALIAVDLKDGERLWETTAPTLGQGRDGRHGTAFLVRHQDRFFIFSETGDLILARLTRAGYDEISRQKIIDPTNEAFGRPVVWSHPAFAEKSVFARNDRELVCVNLSAGN